MGVFRTFTPAILIMLALTAIISTSWLGAYAYVSMHPPLTHLMRPMEVRTPEGMKLSETTAGSAVVLHQEYHRKPSYCWAIYHYLMTGPVSYQFPALRSQTLIEVEQDVAMDMLMPLPHGLPPGEYAWSLLVFPICMGIDKRPFQINLGVSTTIVR